jgi:two-component system OmpR family response regulator
LLARIHARIRNKFPPLLDEALIGPFRIDDRRKEISYQNKILELSAATEFELLKFLVINLGPVLSKQHILDKVWVYDFGGEENIVEVYIRSSRDKLNDKEHLLIRTLRGAGYRVEFFIIAGLPLLIGVLQFLFMKHFLYHSKAMCMQSHFFQYLK